MSNVVSFPSKKTKNIKEISEFLNMLAQGVYISLSQDKTSIIIRGEHESKEISVDKLLLFLFDKEGEAAVFQVGECLTSIDCLHVRDYIMDMQGEE